MATPVQTLRSDIPGKRPAPGEKLEGELYVNFPDRVIGVIDPSGNPLDLATGTGRIKLTGDDPSGPNFGPDAQITDFWVNQATGNDDTSDGSEAAPWATIQKAFDYIGGQIDFDGKVARLNIGPGEYEYSSYRNPFGGGYFLISGFSSAETILHGIGVHYTGDQAVTIRKVTIKPDYNSYGVYGVLGNISLYGDIVMDTELVPYAPFYWNGGSGYISGTVEMRQHGVTLGTREVAAFGPFENRDEAIPRVTMPGSVFSLYNCITFVDYGSWTFTGTPDTVNGSFVTMTNTKYDKYYPAGVGDPPICKRFTASKDSVIYSGKYDFECIPGTKPGTWDATCFYDRMPGPINADNKAGAVATGSFPPDPANAQYVLNKLAGGASDLVGAQNGLTRWVMSLGNDAPETGNGSGSDFSISRWDDTGKHLGPALWIQRSTGQVNFDQPPMVNGEPVGDARKKLTEPITNLYVEATGNDETGDGSQAAPWATLKRVATYFNEIDFNGRLVHLSIGAGTFAQGMFLGIVGNGTLSIEGAGSALTTITGYQPLYFSSCAVVAAFNKLTLLPDAGGYGFFASYTTQVTIGGAPNDIVFDTRNTPWVFCYCISVAVRSNRGVSGQIEVRQSGVTLASQPSGKLPETRDFVEGRGLQSSMIRLTDCEYTDYANWLLTGPPDTSPGSWLSLTNSTAIVGGTYSGDMNIKKFGLVEFSKVETTAAGGVDLLPGNVPGTWDHTSIYDGVWGTPYGKDLVVSGGATQYPAGSDPGNATLVLNKDVAGSNDIVGAVNGSTRWTLTLGNDAPEFGTGQGSEFSLNAWDDTGKHIGPVIRADRTGKVTIPNLDTGRTVLTEDLNFYIAVTGNDETGDGTQANPWATAKPATDYLKNSVDFNGRGVTLNFGAGQFDGSIILSGMVGGGAIAVQGVSAAETTLTAILCCVGAWNNDNTEVWLRRLTLTPGVGMYGVYAQGGAVYLDGDIVFSTAKSPYTLIYAGVCYVTTMGAVEVRQGGVVFADKARDNLALKALGAPMPPSDERVFTNAMFILHDTVWTEYSAAAFTFTGATPDAASVIFRAQNTSTVDVWGHPWSGVMPVGIRFMFASYCDATIALDYFAGTLPGSWDVSCMVNGVMGGVPSGRQVLTGDLSLYVEATGSDTADGKSVATAWATLDKAAQWINDTIDPNSKVVTLNIGVGTFVGAVKHFTIATGSLYIIGAGIDQTIITQTAYSPCFGLTGAGVLPYMWVKDLTMTVASDTAALRFANCYGCMQNLAFNLNNGGALCSTAHSMLNPYGNLEIRCSGTGNGWYGLVEINDFSEVYDQGDYVITGAPNLKQAFVMVYNHSHWYGDSIASVTGGPAVTGAEYLLGFGSTMRNPYIVLPGTTAGSSDISSFYNGVQGTTPFTTDESRKPYGLLKYEEMRAASEAASAASAPSPVAAPAPKAPPPASARPAAPPRPPTPTRR